MTEQTPFETLRAAIFAYGEAAMENLLRCRAFGYAVAEGFAVYLRGPEGTVGLVPATGPFNPNQSYGDAAFSYDPNRPIRLEPIAFGISLTIKNAEDSGSLWIRTPVRVEVKDERFEVFVADQPRLRVPLAFEGQLQPLFETMMREFLDAFRQELEDFGDERYQSRLGFVTETAK